MRVIVAPDIRNGSAANDRPDLTRGSLFGRGLHDSNDPDPIKKLVKLRDAELLHERPAEFCLAAYCRSGCGEWTKSWSPDEARAGVTDQKLLMAGFNRVLSSCGISATGIAYLTFEEILRRVGVGDSINLRTSPGIIEPVFSYSKMSRLALQPVTPPVGSCSEPAVLCFGGHIEKLSRLHRLLTWSAESKTPLIVAATGYGQEVLRTVAANTAAGKFSVVLLQPDLSEDIGHFAINDLARLSGTCVVEELPESFQIEMCGGLNEARPIGGWTAVDCDSDMMESLRIELDAQIADLPPDARVVAARRRSMVIGGRMTVTVPDLGVPGVSHPVDELSVMLSLWSAFIKEKHVKADDGLHSLPFDTLVRSARYVRDTAAMLDGIGLYIERAS